MAGGERWVEVSPSQFTHETEGLALVRALLPDESPFRAWSNFEFRDSRGRWHEVDLLVLGRGRLHLVELKHYRGTLRGDDHTWLRAGHRAEDSPLRLARRKAQYLASKLTDALFDWGKEKRVAISNPKLIVPFIQESVFLHHADFKSELPASSAIGLYGIDGREATSNLPGISDLLLEQPHKSAIGPNQEAILVDLMAKIGLVQRRERTAGSWTITDQALADGDGWQEWLAHHNVAQQERARIRFQVTPAGAPASEEQRVRRIAEHEYAVMGRLQHDGILRPKDLVQSELGIGLAYDYHESWQPLDLWLADQPNGVALSTQLSIIRQIGEALQYAHANKVVHRALSPRAVWVRSVTGTQGDVKVRVGGWEGVGILDKADLTHTAMPGVTVLQGEAAGASDAHAGAFGAPEGQWSPTADRARIDVFGLGALAFYVLSTTPPATGRSELTTRLLNQDGLDLAVELPQISSELRDLVLKATRPAPTKRTGDVGTFLSLLNAAERAANRPEESSTDPLEATPGAQLASGRFELIRRLGQGSTAVGLLVEDKNATSSVQSTVLKVALHDDAAKRLGDEAEVLRSLDSPRIVKLIEGPLTVNGRQSLLLESAGEQTLGHELQGRTRLSLDLLERYGTDLLDAVVTLDKAGIDHRDIKPSNLGVRENRGDRTKHLVLFDFSLTRAAASATNAGTPPYLDPFLVGKRSAYDSAAERYAAAVVLFEMATGQTPHYGDDPNAAPATIADDAHVTPDLFDPTLAPRLVEFFTTALARDIDARHHTAESMRQAWRDIFAAEATTEPDESADAQAAAATLTTSLTDSGLTARALSALEPENIATVGELLATDPVRIARLKGVADATRKQINRRIKEWRQRLGDVAAPKLASDRAAAANTLEAAAETLLAPVAAERTKSRAGMVRLVLGIGTDLDAFATQAQLGANLPDPVNAARAGQILTELQQAWAAEPAALDLLGRMVEHFETTMLQDGFVLTPAEATASMATLFTPSADEASLGRQDERIAAGLVRLTLERIRELRRADEDAARPVVIRRRQGQVTLIGQEQSLLDVAEWVAARAEELVAQSGDRASAFVPARRAAVELSKVFESMSLPQVPLAMREHGRLAELAGAVSATTATTAAGDLHHRDLSPVTALKLTFGDAATVQSLDPKEIRERVQVRFPGLAPLPQRPRLDVLVRDAGLMLQYDDRRRAYRSLTRTGDTTGLESRQPTTHATTPPVAATSEATRRIEESLRTRSFLAIGVPADRLDKFQRGVVGAYVAHLVDVTGILIEELRSQAAKAGVPWEAVRAADAESATSRAGQGLAQLVKQSWSGVSAVVQDALTADGDGPVVLTETGPLARYDNMALLAQWTDLGTSRARPVWLVVPQLAANRGAMLDGQPVPLGTPTQFMNVDSEWVDALGATAAPANNR